MCFFIIYFIISIFYTDISCIICTDQNYIYSFNKGKHNYSIFLTENIPYSSLCYIKIRDNLNVWKLATTTSLFAWMQANMPNPFLTLFQLSERSWEYHGWQKGKSTLLQALTQGGVIIFFQMDQTTLLILQVKHTIRAFRIIPFNIGIGARR